VAVWLLIMIALAAAAFAAARMTGVKPAEILTGGAFKLAAISIGVRLVFTLLPFTHPVDMVCFKTWSYELFGGGLRNFYLQPGLHDYPPGYMYCLWLLGAARSLFDLDYHGYTYTLLEKLPSILADAMTALLIYRIAKPRADDKNAPFFIALLYALNPAVILVSSVWGQVDSVPALMITACVYWLTADKPARAFALFGAALAVKPQSLPFGLIFLYYAWHYLKSRRYSRGAFGRLGAACAAAPCVMAALAAPFVPVVNGHWDPAPVIVQYINTLTAQYNYATVCAYNIWALLGLNWGDIDAVFLGVPVWAWGMALLAAGAASAVWALSRRKRAGWFLSAGWLLFCVFMFMAKMHERYMFASMALFLAAYAMEPLRDIRRAYIFISAALFVNMADVLRVSLSGFNWAMLAVTSRVFSLATLAAFIYAAAVVRRYALTRRREG